MIEIGRPINGITLNGLEYVLDENGNVLKFKDEAAAMLFLQSHGIEKEELLEILENGGLVFEEVDEEDEDEQEPVSI